MSQFTTEIVIDDKNRIVQVEAPTGEDYIEMLVELNKGITKKSLYQMIHYCTDLQEEEIEKMKPRAFDKIFRACNYAIRHEIPESDEELVGETFKQFSIEEVL